MIRSTTRARDAILGKIRSSLSATADDTERRVAIQKRLYEHPEGIIPARARLDHDALIAQFRAMLERQSATVTQVAGVDDIPETVAAYLRDNNLPARVRTGTDEMLGVCDWSRAPNLEIEHGPAQPDDSVGLSRAAVGISETGTLMLVSGPENPTTLNFLPETHIIVLRAGDIAGPYEAGWAHLRERYGERTMPRTVNFISGPSRTADIEQTIIMGAHGPKRMLVIVVE